MAPHNFTVSFASSERYPPIMVCWETLLSYVYTARRSHFGVVSIDKALSAGEFHSLMKITKVHDFADLLTADLDSSYQQSADDAGTQMQTSKCCTCVTTVSHSWSKTYFQHVVYSMAYKQSQSHLNWQNWIVWTSNWFSVPNAIKL